jgi:hypothetical protein
MDSPDHLIAENIGKMVDKLPAERLGPEGRIEIILVAKPSKVPACGFF